MKLTDRDLSLLSLALSEWQAGPAFDEGEIMELLRRIRAEAYKSRRYHTWLTPNKPKRRTGLADRIADDLKLNPEAAWGKGGK